MAGRSWANPPVLAMVGGSEEFYVLREKRKMLRSAYAHGRRPFPYATPHDILEAIEDMEMYQTRSILWVEDVKGIDPEVFAAVKAQNSNAVAVVLVLNQDLDVDSLPEICQAVPPAYRMVFNRPKTIAEKEKAAIKFIKSEIKARGLTCDDDLMDSLMRAVGQDLGVLYFEIMKIAILAKSMRITNITPDIVKSTYRHSDDINIKPLMRALSLRDVKGIAKQLIKLQSQDVIALLLRAKTGMSESVLIWLQTSIMLSQNIDVQDIAARIGQTKWQTEKFIIPAAKAWGPRDLKRLLSVLAKADQALVSGAPSVWNYLLSSVIEVAHNR